MIHKFTKMEASTFMEIFPQITLDKKPFIYYNKVDFGNISIKIFFILSKKGDIK